jgi:anti-anti-sigma factor
MNLTYELRADSRDRRLVLHGEIDLAVRDELRAILEHAIRRSHRVTEVDLHDVTFLDCSGIGVLVAANTTAHRHRRSVIVTYPRGIVRRVLEITDVLLT